MMAFMGVRISWLMLNRNSRLARFAAPFVLECDLQFAILFLQLSLILPLLFFFLLLHLLHGASA